MNETVAAEAAVDEIPVDDLIALVRGYAADNDWCEQVEQYLAQLGVKFAYAVDTCWCEMCAPSEPKRFALAVDSPTTVDKARAIDVMKDVEADGFSTTSKDFIAEAAARWGLKPEATR
jgi:hypothetical protein